MPSELIIEPQAGPQQAFLSSEADIAIYGGAAGGGKTWALLYEPVRNFHVRKFGGVIFRRTYPQITSQGGLWDESSDLYPGLGGKPNESSHSWTFPSGATMSFRHMQHEKNKFDWQGAQVPYIGWDELTHFTESQFFYMLSRLRSTSGVRPYMRATVNPDAGSWVARLIDWWIADDGYADMERAGKLRYFLRVAGRLEWADTARELEFRFPELTADAPPKSLTFVPASVYDNKALLQKDPGYLANLMALHPLEQARLLGDKVRGGNWKVQAGGGEIFHRDWFPVIDRSMVPKGGEECRFWDFAASDYTKEGRKKEDKKKPYTAGVLIRKVGAIYYVMDCVAVQEGPAGSDEVFFRTTRQDVADASIQHTRYKSRWETEGGSAGKKETYRLTTALDGIDAGGVPPQGDKYVRATPFAVQAKAGNVRVVRADWTDDFIQHLHNQPNWPVKDIMDAAAGAYSAIAGKRRADWSNSRPFAIGMQ